MFLEWLVVMMERHFEEWTVGLVEYAENSAGESCGPEEDLGFEGEISGRSSW